MIQSPPRLTHEQKASEAAAILEQSLDDDIDRGEVIQKAAYTTAPISIRISAPLLRKIDRQAESEGRSRSNLMQRILSEYFRANPAGR